MHIKKYKYTRGYTLKNGETMINDREITIIQTANGFILKEITYSGKVYIFKTFQELLDWIKEVYEWK